MRHPWEKQKSRYAGARGISEYIRNMRACLRSAEEQGFHIRRRGTRYSKKQRQIACDADTVRSKGELPVMQIQLRSKGELPVMQGED